MTISYNHDVVDIADMPMERKTPVAYPDGVYEIAGGDRGNVILIANISQHGLTGFGSTRRTALFTFFGKSTCHLILYIAGWSVVL